MTAQTKLPPVPPVNPEVRPEPRSISPKKETKVACRGVYWGDRLTLIFWLLCFGLMLAINLIEFFQWLVLFLVGRSPAP
jgi:hypothetical protein